MHVAHQRSQFFHRVVHRVGNGTGDVFRHRGFLRQVAFGHRLQFVHQPQNGGLVGIVDALGVLLLRFGSHTLAFCDQLTLAAFEQLDIRQRRATGQRKQRRRHHGEQLTPAQTGGGRQLALKALETRPQRLAVADHAGLRLAGRHQTLQVAQNGTSVGAGLLVQLQQGFQPLADLRIGGGLQAQLGAAVEQAFSDFLEGVQVLAQQEHGLGAHAFHGQELVRRFADALRQHHQLACRRDLGRGSAKLQLQRRDCFSDFQEVGRLAVDGAKRVTHLGQDLLLRQHHAGIALGGIHLGQQLAQQPLKLGAQRAQSQCIITLLEATHVARQHVGTVLHFSEGSRVANQGLGHTLGQPLRLHQCLTAGSHLLTHFLGLVQHEEHHRRQQHHRKQQQGAQGTTMLLRAPPTKHRQAEHPKLQVGWLRTIGAQATLRKICIVARLI